MDVAESRQGVMMGGALKIATKIVGKRLLRSGGWEWCFWEAYLCKWSFISL